MSAWPWMTSSPVFPWKHTVYTAGSQAWLCTQHPEFIPSLTLGVWVRRWVRRQLWLFNSHPLGGWDASSGLETTGSLSPGICPGLCSTIICPFLRMLRLTLVAMLSLCFSRCGCRVRLGVTHMGSFQRGIMAAEWLSQYRWPAPGSLMVTHLDRHPSCQPLKV